MTGRDDGSEIVRVPTRLVVRESCGCRPEGKVRAYAAPETGERLAEKIVGAVLVEGWHARLEELDALCRRAAGDSPRVRWQVLSVLEDHLLALSDGEGEAVTVRQMEEVLRRTRAVVDAQVQHQYDRRVVQQTNVDEQMSYITTRMMTSVDAGEVMSVLSHAPEAGIRRLVVAFYDREGDDPVGWSNIQASVGLKVEVDRFRTRTFPPSGLYPADRPFCVVVLPLVVRGETLGFAAFDATRLALCGHLAWHLGAALRSVRLYEEAVEGRRLAEEASRLKSRFLSIGRNCRFEYNSRWGRPQLCLFDRVLRQKEWAAGEGCCSGMRSAAAGQTGKARGDHIGV